MIAMLRIMVAACLAWATATCATDAKSAAYPLIEYQVAFQHEIKPHRSRLPLEGVRSGSHQLGLTLTVSPAGDVTSAEHRVDPELEALWPKVETEVLKWKFAPFEVEGRPATVRVEEYVELVPPERLPTRHVKPPVLRADSDVKIVLERTVCYGRCPAYQVTVTPQGIVFEGDAYVATKGKQKAGVDANAVRRLAQKFIDADFYSFDDVYHESVTDNPTYVLSISIDGRTKKVVDYVGTSVGMPAMVTELEEDVDALAETDRWIKGH